MGEHVTSAANAGRAPALHDQTVRQFFDANGVCFQSCGNGSEAIGFLDAELFKPAHDGLALGKGGRHREHRIFVDHGRRAFGRNLDTFERGMTHGKIADILAAFVAAIKDANLRAHFLQRHDEADAARIEHHALQHDFRAWNDERGYQRERGR